VLAESDLRGFHIFIECDDTDTLDSFRAGYKFVGLKYQQRVSRWLSSVMFKQIRLVWREIQTSERRFVSSVMPCDGTTASEKFGRLFNLCRSRRVLCRVLHSDTMHDWRTIVLIMKNVLYTNPVFGITDKLVDTACDQ
jgi:hypothetical protein